MENIIIWSTISYATKQIVIGKASLIEPLAYIQIIHIHNNVLIGFNMTAHFLYFSPKFPVKILDINFKTIKIKKCISYKSP